MATTKKYSKYRTLLLPKEIVDLILLCEHREPLSNVKEPVSVITFSIVNDIIIKSDLHNRKEEHIELNAPMYSGYLKMKYGNDYPKYIHWMIMNKIAWNGVSYKGKSMYLHLFSFKQYSEFIKELLFFTQGSLDGILSTYCIKNNIEIKPISIDNKGIEANQKNRISKKWYSIKVPISRTNKKYLTKEYEDDSVFINNAPRHLKKMGSHYRKSLDIRYDDAVRFVDDHFRKELELSKTEKDVKHAEFRYMSRLMSIEAIHHGRQNKTLRFSRNPTNYRLDTNLTNMATELRQFIVGYQDMAYLDLSNSQPVLFNTILRKQLPTAPPRLRAEIKRYEELTMSGQWYEWLESIYSLTREECKQIWMQIAYSENKHYKDQKKIFEREFPLIGKFIRQLKKNNYSDFAISLQRIESKIFIDEICKRLVGEDIIPYTLHDGLLVPMAHKKKTFETMAEVLKKHLGSVPMIKDETGQNLNGKYL